MFDRRSTARQQNTFAARAALLLFAGILTVPALAATTAGISSIDGGAISVRGSRSPARRRCLFRCFEIRECVFPGCERRESCFGPNSIKTLS